LLLSSQRPTDRLVQIGFSTTAASLSNTNLYLNFNRVVPSDDVQIEVDNCTYKTTQCQKKTTTKLNKNTIKQKSIHGNLENNKSPTSLYQVRVITVFTVFRLLTDFVCLYTYEF